MKKTYSLFLVTLLGFLFSHQADGDEFARGTVYLDSNGNQQYDKGEKPVPGVRVSNGVQIVKTGDDGRYSLPVAEDTFIFVIKIGRAHV